MGVPYLQWTARLSSEVWVCVLRVRDALLPPQGTDYLRICFKSGTEPNVLNDYKDVHKNDKVGTFLHAVLVIFQSYSSYR